MKYYNVLICLIWISKGYSFSLSIFNFYSNTINPKPSKTVCHAKPKKDVSLSQKAQAYIRMRDFKKLQNEGANIDEMKEFLVNGTVKHPTGEDASTNTVKDFISSSSGTISYQQVKNTVKGKKGSLDARLRAVIAYKRQESQNILIKESSSATNGELTDVELDELDQLDSDDDDEEYIDDEDAEYESLITKALEMKKLNELKRNFLLDKSMRNDDSLQNPNNMNVSTTNISMTDSKSQSSLFTKEVLSTSDENSDDLYIPTRQSWGVFPRPKDISKSFGGGRVITKAEMDKMDREWEEKERKDKIQNQAILQNIASTEKVNNDKLKNALSTARVYMSVGDRLASVKALESVKNFTSEYTELGGEVLLEYGMALETVERFDEATQIYSTLASKSWSQKIKGNALALLQGLEITRQIRKDKTPPKPLMDPYSMQMISDALRPGLRNEWDEYSKKTYKDPSTQPWLDDEFSKSSITKITTMSDAYKIFISALDPLRKVTSDIINQAFVYAASSATENEKIVLLRSRGIIKPEAKAKQLIPQYALQFSMFNTSTNSNQMQDRLSAAEDFNNVLSKMTGGINPVQSDEDAPITFEILTKSKKAEKKVYDLSADSLPNIYLGSLNGTWDLILSSTVETDFLTFEPVARSKKYDYGDVRRILFTDNKLNQKMYCQEIFPTLWGLNTAKITLDVHWKPESYEIMFSGSQMSNSVAPWQKKSQSSQQIELIYCDDTIKLTKQSNITDGKRPDLFCLWKRVLPTVWRKY